MRKLVVINDSNVDVENYPIAEALLDGEENLVIDTGTGEYVSTGKTHEWSIKSGEKMYFPFYVADVLKSRFDFLKVRQPEDIKKEIKADETENSEEEKIEEKDEGNKIYTCKYCKKSFDSAPKLGRHKGLAHAELVAAE